MEVLVFAVELVAEARVGGDHVRGLGGEGGHRVVGFGGVLGWQLLQSWLSPEVCEDSRDK